MVKDLNDLTAFVAVARAGGFREGARLAGLSPSSVSEAVRRLEAQLDARLLNRTTRSVALTDAGRRLFDRLGPALGEVEASLDAVNAFRDQPAGVLRLNVPGVVARLVLPAIVGPFLSAYPRIRLEVTAEESFVDVLAAGCDAGVRYGERLEQDMVAVPIGPRTQRMATCASPSYLAANGRPDHPRDLLSHRCIRGRFASGSTPPWEFEQEGEVIRIDPHGSLVVQSSADLMADAARADVGVVHIFEAWLQPHIDSGDLIPVLEPWWQSFSGPFLYYPGRRQLPAPLRAFVDFIKS